MNSLEVQEKIQRYLGYLEQDKSNYKLMLNISNCYQSMDDLESAQEHRDAAMRVLEERIKANPGDADSYGALALLHFDLFNLEEAESLCLQALAIESTHYDGRLVRVLINALDNKSSIEEIQTLLEVKPDETRLWFALGTVYTRDMNINAAVEAFTRCLQIWPDFYDAIIGLSWCHLLRNDLDNAEKCYKKTIVLDESDSSGWGGLALVYALKNNESLADEYLCQALSLYEEDFLAALASLMVSGEYKPEELGDRFNELFPAINEELAVLVANYVHNFKVDGAGA